MKPIQRDEILDLGAYEAIRDRFRARVIEEKKRRRVLLGPSASCVFENRDTALMQIQEMLRTERITREGAVLHEIETYNQLVPADGELSATLMIEIDDRQARDTFLTEGRGLDRAFALEIDGERFAGKWDAARELPDRTTTVHYLKFPLSEAARAKLAAIARGEAKPATVAAALLCDHDVYRHRAELPPELVASVAEDVV
jgi:hypothetical protein